MNNNGVKKQEANSRQHKYESNNVFAGNAIFCNFHHCVCLSDIILNLLKNIHCFLLSALNCCFNCFSNLPLPLPSTDTSFKMYHFAFPRFIFSQFFHCP